MRSITWTQTGGNSHRVVIDDDLKPYEGRIDDVRIWNRALTPVEVMMLYSAGTSTTI